jgi:hypothetical protein
VVSTEESAQVKRKPMQVSSTRIEHDEFSHDRLSFRSACGFQGYVGADKAFSTSSRRIRIFPPLGALASDGSHR